MSLATIQAEEQRRVEAEAAARAEQARREQEQADG